jgi:hypothetical protein
LKVLERYLKRCLILAGTFKYLYGLFPRAVLQVPLKYLNGPLGGTRKWDP